VIRSNSKINEDWERKLREREENMERERNEDKEEKMGPLFLFFFK